MLSRQPEAGARLPMLGDAFNEGIRQVIREASGGCMAEDDAKVLLVGSLNKDTLQRLDTYVMTRDNDKESRKGTI